MSHLLLVIFILSLVVAFSSTFVSYLFYQKYKNRSLKYGVFYNCILFLYVFLILIRQYVWNAQLENSSIYLIIINSLFYIWFFLMFQYFPRFIYSIIDHPFSRFIKYMVRVLAIIPVANLLLPFIIYSDINSITEFLQSGILYIYNTILGSMIIYLFIFLFLNYKKIVNTIVRKIVRNILIITAIFLPGLAYDLFIRGKLGPNVLINGSIFSAFFIFVWNITALVVFFKFYSVKINLSFQQSKVMPDEFYQKFKITVREKEIISLLLDNKTSVQIGSQLFISPRTVDKHIENIYKKMGTNNKNDLITEIKKVTLD
mgnify:CR=1 FL=1